MSSRKGVGLIEAIVALLILAISGGAIVMMGVQIASSNNYARLRNQGVTYAQEAIEQVRSYYQINGFMGLSQAGSSGGNCYTSGSLASPATCTASSICGVVALQISGTSFYRLVKVVTTGSQVHAIVTISWQEKTVCQKAELDSYYYYYL